MKEHYMAAPPATSAASVVRRRSTFAWTMLILANVLWAASYVAAKYVLTDVSVTTMLALRMGISALVLLPLLIVKRKELHLTRKVLPQLLLLVLTGFIVNKFLEYAGLALTTASDVALLITSESILPPRCHGSCCANASDLSLAAHSCSVF